MTKINIKIMPYSGALEYTPNNKTYAIRIESSDFPPVRPLKESKNYIHIAKYHFDDNSEKMTLGKKWFTKEIADEILKDFCLHKDNIDTLLVHCIMGQNRSPAVAIALNEAFDLGHDSKILKNKFREYNQFVYETLLHRAKEVLKDKDAE